MSKVISMIPEKDFSAFDSIIGKYQAADVADVIEQVAMLAAGFPQGSKPTESVENSVKAYCVALEQLPIEPIHWAVMSFLKGKVDGQSLKFMPTSAELAKEARRMLFLWDHQLKKTGEKK